MAGIPHFEQINSAPVGWQLKATLLCCLLALFVQAPRFDLLWSRIAEVRGSPATTVPDRQSEWVALKLKIDSPMTDMAKLYPSESNWAKRTFRIVPSAVAHVIHLGIPGFFALQVLAGVGQMYLLLGWILRATGNRGDAFLLTALLATTYYGGAAFFDSRGWGDPFAYFFLTAALVTANPGVSAVMIFLAGFTDERAIPASLLVLVAQLEWRHRGAGAERRLTLPELLASRFVWAAVSAWVAYFIVRFGLVYFFDYEQAMGGFDFSMASRFYMLPLHLLFSLKLLLIPLVWLGVRRWVAGPHVRLLALAGLGLYFLVSFSVYDQIKSLAYLGPVAAFALCCGYAQVARHTTNPALLRKGLVVALLIHMLIPTATLLHYRPRGRNIDAELQYPMPLELLWVGQKFAERKG